MIIMKKETKTKSYSSPSMELMALTSESAVMTGSVATLLKGADNEEFTSGGSFSDWTIN